MSETTPNTEAHQAEPFPPSYPNVPESKTDRLGRTAMYLAITVFVLSAAASVLIGLYGTTIYHYQTTTLTSGHGFASVGFHASPNQLAFATQSILGSGLGITALVLGIVATAQKRGRRYGVIAIVLAGTAPLISVILFTVFGLAFGHHINP